MTFTLDPEVAAALAAAGDRPPMPAAGDVARRRAALNPMLEYFNNHVQPISTDITITDYHVQTADGAQLLAPRPSRKPCVPSPAGRESWAPWGCIGRLSPPWSKRRN